MALVHTLELITNVLHSEMKPEIVCRRTDPINVAVQEKKFDAFEQDRLEQTEGRRLKLEKSTLQ